MAMRRHASYRMDRCTAAAACDGCSWLRSEAIVGRSEVRGVSYQQPECNWQRAFRRRCQHFPQGYQQPLWHSGPLNSVQGPLYQQLPPFASPFFHNGDSVVESRLAPHKPDSSRKWATETRTTSWCARV